ncbi:MAG: LytTR family transcriptional regulator DNA-binding domain-containing protein [Flavobacteriales bacterium]|nr:LytTR family transcriptional regulator DNA-binding domain-containing protein [Flavobacteriales bacterium]
MIKSIAVLAFENLNKSQELEYLCKSFPLEINHQLSKYKTIKLIANHSIKSFNSLPKNSEIDLLIKGSFLKIEKQIRFNIEIYNHKTTNSLTSIKLEDGSSNVFELIDKVSTDIIKFLELKLIPKKNSQKIPSIVYQNYLKGLQYWNSWNEIDIKKAIDFFKNVVKQEPEFALGYARISHCYSLLATIDLENSSKFYQLAKSAGLKAINLDNSIIEAHLSLTLIKLLNDIDILGAYYSIEKAFSINNLSSEAHYYYAFYLLTIGKYNQAIDAVKYSLENDHLNVQKNSTYGFALSLSGKYDLAEKQLKKTLDLNPNSIPTYDALIWNYIMSEQFEKAIELVNKKDIEVFLTPATQIVIYHNLGLSTETEIWKNKLLALLKEDSSVKYDREASFSFYELGDKKSGIKHLELFYRQKKGFIRVLTHPAWKKIRKSDNFYIYKKRLKLLKAPTLSTNITKATEDVIVLNSNTSEFLSIPSKNLLYIESQGSYAEVVYLDDSNKIKKRILRTSLNKIINESLNPCLYRCHNSFIINTKISYSVLGNRKELKLHLKEYLIVIPVSRNKASEIYKYLD